VGANVERVPRGAEVAEDPAERPDGFGPWFRRQRELRGISVWFVAARTKLPPERVREIETGKDALARDGHGRGTARALARAIGADPEEAAARLAGRSPRRARRGRLPWLGDWLRVGGAVGIALSLGLGAWLLALWLGAPVSPEDSPALVYRPDYVEQLLNRDGS